MNIVPSRLASLAVLLLGPAAGYGQQPPPASKPAPAPPAGAPGARQPKADPFASGKPAPQDPSASKSADPVDPFAAGADADGEERPQDILATWVAFSMPPAQARKAVLAHPKQAALYQWCTEQSAKAGSGVGLEFITSVSSRLGEMAKTEAVNDYPYPTEFDPPQIPQSYGLLQNRLPENDAAQNRPAPPGTVPGPADQLPIPVGPGNPATSPLRPADLPAATPALPGEMKSYPMIDALSPWPTNSSTPQAFQYRTTGLTIEFESTLDDSGHYVMMNVAPELLKVLAVIPWSSSADINQPIFGTQKATTALVGAIGQPALIGTFNSAANTGAPGSSTTPAVWFLFVTPSLP